MGLDEGAGALLRAWHERPTRAEPLYDLAKQYRLAGMNRIAWMFANEAARINKPDDILFVEEVVYDRGIDEELSISAFYAGEKESGLAACERLLANPRADHAQAKRNQVFYTNTIDVHRTVLDRLVPESLRTFDGVTYWCSNPSTCGEAINVRLVNYQQEKGKRYWGHPDPGIIRTKNAIIGPDKSVRILDDSILRSWNQHTRIFGLEDLRLFTFRDAIWFSATCCQEQGANGNPRVVLGRVSKDLARVEHLVPLSWSGANLIEKNWLLYAQDDELRAVYSFDPFTLLTGINPDTGDVFASTGNPVRWFAGRFRGSTSPVQLKLGMGDVSLSIVHDVANFAEGNVYAHRFVLFNEKGVIMYSAPFFFEHAGVEYACGMTLRGDDLIISYGFEDREAKMIRLRAADVLTEMDRPPPER